MGKRKNVSQTTVIQTNLVPLSDALSINASDTIAQWYNVDTNTYSPDRTVTPLVLTPVVTAADKESGQEFVPSFSAWWYVFDINNETDYSSTDSHWPGLHWVKVEAGAAETAGVTNDYWHNGNLLVVQKNISPENPTLQSGVKTSGENLCCVAVYTDPRDIGATVTLSGTVLLVTNKDAEDKTLRINILAPNTTMFNFVRRGFTEYGTQTERERSIYQFRAKILDCNNNDVTSQYYIEWWAKVNNSTNSVLIDTLPCYTETTQVPMTGQGHNIIRLDAMYVENIQIIVGVRETSTSPLLPYRGRCNLLWDYPNIEGVTVSETGRAVNSINRLMKFSTIVNLKGNSSCTLTEQQKKENFLFHYLGRKPIQNGFTDIDMGWGLETVIESWKLKNPTYSIPVHTEIFTLGPYEAVTDNNEVVTDNGDVVYDRIY